MGQVWFGVHRAQGVPVAVKVITSERAREDSYLQAFHNEVSAMAGLDHPGIVMVFDYGTVSEAAAAASDKALVHGSPYLAMELATGGSMRDASMPATWPELRDMLLGLLDALAHAHARGVVHRDLKPGNVLVFEEEPARRGGELHVSKRLRLTDFGLAHALETADEEDVRVGQSGTPRYMAPEQFAARWREFGPWTDLYALGCVGYRLATGIPPFPEQGFSRLKRAHLTVAVPPMDTRFEVPAGLERWLRRLLEKHPRDRFQTAADATYALLELDEPVGLPKEGGRPVDSGVFHTFSGTIVEYEKWNQQGGVPDEDAVTVLDTFVGTEDGPEEQEIDDFIEPIVEPAAVGSCARVLPPMPSEWRREQRLVRSMRLVGAGLGLFGLRRLPLLGREGVRDALWKALADVRRRGEPRLVTLSGPSGVGKSRVAEWLCQRGEELGAACAMRVWHRRADLAGSGLPRTLARALGVSRLPRPRIERRLERWMRDRGVEDSYDWLALTEIIEPHTDPDARGVVHFGQRDERHALLVRVLRMLSGGLDEGQVRPVVLWIDDAQWGGDALAFADYLMRTPMSGPVLIVAVVQEEALGNRPVERSLLEALAGRSRADEIEIGPLDAEHHTELVHELLGLEGVLAEQVAERTAGNPLFAVQLVGDWVQRGVLEVGTSGFVLSPGERADVPDDIHDLWDARIGRVVASMNDRRSLELAALLGQDVPLDEWLAACTLARSLPRADLVEDLRAARLAVIEPSGWRFVHGMLVESLERSAREGGRWQALHAACASMLADRQSMGGPGVPERLGHHLVQSGCLEEALAPLLEGARERRQASAYDDALVLLAQRETVLVDLDAAPGDPRWGQGWALRADLLVGMGRLAEAEEVAEQAIVEGTAAGWNTVVAQAYRHAGTAAGRRGDLAAWEQLAGKAERVAIVAGDKLELARCVQARATATRLRGAHADAVAQHRDALLRFTALRDLRGQADALVGMAAAEHAMGNLRKSEEYTRPALDLFNQVGSRFGAAACHNALGEALRGRGELKAAEEAYRQAEAMMRSTGSREWVIPKLNRALVLLGLDEPDKALVILDDVLLEVEATGRQPLQVAAHAFLLQTLTLLGEWAAWDEHYARLSRLLEASGFADPDVARALTRAGDDASERRQPRRAVLVWRLAHRLWIAMEQPEAAAVLDERLAGRRPPRRRRSDDSGKLR